MIDTPDISNHTTVIITENNNVTFSHSKSNIINVTSSDHHVAHITVLSNKKLHLVGFKAHINHRTHSPCNRVAPISSTPTATSSSNDFNRKATVDGEYLQNSTNPRISSFNDTTTSSSQHLLNTSGDSDNRPLIRESKDDIDSRRSMNVNYSKVHPRDKGSFLNDDDEHSHIVHDNPTFDDSDFHNSSMGDSYAYLKTPKTTTHNMSSSSPERLMPAQTAIVSTNENDDHYAYVSSNNNPPVDTDRMIEDPYASLSRYKQPNGNLQSSVESASDGYATRRVRPGLQNEYFEEDGSYGTGEWQNRQPYSSQSQYVSDLDVATTPSSQYNQQQQQWRSPDLAEVVEYLTNPIDSIKANAAAYLQHLLYNNSQAKIRCRECGGIPALVDLLSHQIPEVHRVACGALKNLSFGKSMDENKIAIRNCGGIRALINLLERTTDNDVRELVAGTLWNLSSCHELKKSIFDDGLSVLLNTIILPHINWNDVIPVHLGPVNPTDPVIASKFGTELYWSTLFRNATGVLRNISSDGLYARQRLREYPHFLESILFLLQKAILHGDIDNKCIENCVCLLRNISFRAQEYENPDFHKNRWTSNGDSSSWPATTSSRHSNKAGDNGCFGANTSNKRNKSKSRISPKKTASHSNQPSQPNGTTVVINGVPTSSPVLGAIKIVKSPRGKDLFMAATGPALLWQPEIVRTYLPILANSSNPETLEAAVGAIQNLAACDWQPAVDLRASTRKEKGLPIIVELLGIESDRVVCASASALRNLALDPKNRELLGKYGIDHMLVKLPSERNYCDPNASEDTMAAILATLHEVVRSSFTFSSTVLKQNGVERLLLITRSRGLDQGSTPRYSSKVVNFASAVLFAMWQHKDLHSEYKEHGYKESDFVSKLAAVPRGAGSSQGKGTRSSSHTTAVPPGISTDSTLFRPKGTMGVEDHTTSSKRNMTGGSTNFKANGDIGTTSSTAGDSTPKPVRRSRSPADQLDAHAQAMQSQLEEMRIHSGRSQTNLPTVQENPALTAAAYADVETAKILSQLQTLPYDELSPAEKQFLQSHSIFRGDSSTFGSKMKPYDDEQIINKNSSLSSNQRERYLHDNDTPILDGDVNKIYLRNNFSPSHDNSTPYQERYIGNDIDDVDHTRRHVAATPSSQSWQLPHQNDYSSEIQPHLRSEHHSQQINNFTSDKVQSGEDFRRFATGVPRDDENEPPYFAQRDVAEILSHSNKNDYNNFHHHHDNEDLISDNNLHRRMMNDNQQQMESDQYRLISSQRSQSDYPTASEFNRFIGPTGSASRQNPYENATNRRHPSSQSMEMKRMQQQQQQESSYKRMIEVSYNNSLPQVSINQVDPLYARVGNSHYEKSGIEPLPKNQVITQNAGDNSWV